MKFQLKFVKIWQKKIQNFFHNKWANFYLINEPMGPKFEANFAIEIFWGVILLLFYKIWPKFQILWKSDQNWPKFTIKKPFLLSEISFENFPCQIISSR